MSSLDLGISTETWGWAVTISGAGGHQMGPLREYCKKQDTMYKDHVLGRKIGYLKT